MSFLSQIPRPLLVFVVLVLGIIGLFFYSHPHTLCDSQVEALAENQKGYLFPMPVKGTDSKRPPLLEKTLANCRLGQGSPGACFEFFKILNRLTTDMDGVAPSCGETISENVTFKHALSEGLTMMVELAWGETPPEKNDKVTGWFEPPDLSLFCKMKSLWLNFYGPEDFETLKTTIFSKLQARKFTIDPQGHRVCTNCDKSPMALEVLGNKEEVFARSLFSISCRQY